MVVVVPSLLDDGREALRTTDFVGPVVVDEHGVVGCRELKSVTVCAGAWIDDECSSVVVVGSAIRLAYVMFHRHGEGSEHARIDPDTAATVKDPASRQVAEEQPALFIAQAHIEVAPPGNERRHAKLGLHAGVDRQLERWVGDDIDRMRRRPRTLGIAGEQDSRSSRDVTGQTRNRAVPNHIAFFVLVLPLDIIDDQVDDDRLRLWVADRLRRVSRRPRRARG